MRLFWIFAIAILLLQAFAEHSPVSNAANINERSSEIAIDKTHKKYPHKHSKINCSHACSRRCKESSRKNVCHRACKACCLRCHCVPPGTYGNKEACPCYASLRTHGNKLKCP